MEFAYKGKPVSCKRLGYKLWAVMKKAIIPKIKVNDEILIRQHGSNTAKNICIYEIEDACKLRNLTLKDLSKLSGISTRSLEWYVKQERQPSLKRVERLAEVLEVTPAWLVSWE